LPQPRAIELLLFIYFFFLLIQRSAVMSAGLSYWMFSNRSKRSTKSI